MSRRVAIVGACPYPVPQGSQVYLRDSALALRAIGHDPHLITYGHGLGEDTTGLPIHRTPRLPGYTRTAAGPSLSKPLLDLMLARTVRRVVRREHIEAVCAHNYEALLATLVSGVRPIVYLAHNCLADELPHYFRGSRLAGRVGAWLDNHLPRRADAVIAPHERLARYLEARGCPKVHVVPPPVDAATFTRDPVTDAIPPVLYTGNLDAYQNLGLLRDAMVRLHARLPKARLVVATAGEGAFPDAERVHAPDFNSLRRVLAADAVVAAPRVSWSGYPIKLLNAMAAGKPVVACESAAWPLRHNETGLVVPDGDAEAFAEALYRLLTQPGLRERLGRNAGAAAARAHAPEYIGLRIAQIIEGALGAPEPASPK